MKNVLVIILVAMVFAGVVGCCACRKGKNNLPLVGTEWHLVSWIIARLQRCRSN